MRQLGRRTKRRGHGRRRSESLSTNAVTGEPILDLGRQDPMLPEHPGGRRALNILSCTESGAAELAPCAHHIVRYVTDDVWGHEIEILVSDWHRVRVDDRARRDDQAEAAFWRILATVTS